ncbi:MAG TPA: hypothetical protein VFC53_12200 [Dehalococcoidia bacterium]|nr:hypothetical protein [Dehalococcoidia bacterium]
MPRLAVCLVATIALLAAGGCGGSKTPPPAPTVSGGQDAGAGGATAARTPSGGAPASPVADRTSVPGAGLKSFRYHTEFGFSVVGDATQTPGINGSIDGRFAAPDSHAFEQTFDLGGLTLSTSDVIIGDDAWQRESGGEWQKVSRDEISTDLTSADPEFLTLGADADKLDGVDSTHETVNGVQTRHWTFTRAQIQTLQALLGDSFFEGSDVTQYDEFNFDLWLDDADRVIRAAVDGTGPASLLGPDSGLDIDPAAKVRVHVSFDVTDINADGITVEPPI